MNRQTRRVFYVSDKTAITAETLGHSLLTQFDSIIFQQVNLPFVDNLSKARIAVFRINQAYEEDGVKPLVFCTCVDDEVRTQIAQSEGFVLDFFDAFISPLEAEFGVSSNHASGKSHGMGSYTDYKKRIDALNFSLKNDDGGMTREYDAADVVLLGVSRSGKTPTCLYLALQYGLWAANYPITGQDLQSTELPTALRPYQDKLYGLTIDPLRLSNVRYERRNSGNYAEIDQCKYEVRQVEKMFEHENIAFLSTSSISIEEIATTVLQHFKIEKKLLG